MQSSLKPVAVGACVSALAGTLLVGPAAAAPNVPTLVLSIQDKDTMLLPDTRTLGCDSHPGTVTGTHPHRDQACASLEKAGGLFENLPTTDGNCTMIYAPITATARGTYKGNRVDFEAVYANSCVAAAESDNIFSW